MGAVLVTGSLGGNQPHVTSAQDGLLHAGMLGRGGYLLQTRNWTQLPAAKNSNTITIPSWDIVMEGRQVMIDQPTDVTIQSGSQGVKRRDLIVVRYTMNASTGVEAVSLVAIKGTAAASPVDPAYNTGSIIGGALISDLPLCRVNIDGINVTGVDVLVGVLAPLSDVWDSLTQTPYFQCGLHTTTTLADGTFYIGVKSPNGKKADYAAYTVGLYEGVFQQAGEYTVQRWATDDPDKIRFRIWNAKDHAWAGQVALFGNWIAAWNRQ